MVTYWLTHLLQRYDFTRWKILGVCFVQTFKKQMKTGCILRMWTVVIFASLPHAVNFFSKPSDQSSNTCCIVNPGLRTEVKKRGDCHEEGIRKGGRNVGRNFSISNHVRRRYCKIGGNIPEPLKRGPNVFEFPKTFFKLLWQGASVEICRADFIAQWWEIFRQHDDVCRPAARG